MSEILRVNDFGQKGLNTDLSPWDLDTDFLTDMNNVRISNNTLISFGGYQVWTTPPVNFEPSLLKHAGLLTGKAWWIAGKDAVYTWDGYTWIDISSDLGYNSIADKGAWTCDLLSTFLIATHPQIYPEFWSGKSTSAQMLPLPFDVNRTWKDVDKRVGIIRSHKDFLLAFNLNEQGSELLDTFRWSDAADVGSLPTTWDESDPAALSGIAQLGGSGGIIIDGLPLRDSFVIYRENGTSVLDYTGDNFVWRIRHLEETTGVINKNCITEVKGHHFFIGDGDILTNDSNSIRSIMHQRIRKRFVANINVDSFQTAFAINNTLFKEIWFCVPEGVNSTFPNIAYIYNWSDDTWVIRDLKPEAVSISHGPYLYKPIDDTVKIWNGWNSTWNTATGPWGNPAKIPLSSSLVQIRESDGSLLLLDTSTNDNTEEFLSYIERTDIPIQGHDSVVSIQTIYPHMKSSVPVRIRVGSQQRAGGPVSWKSFINFDPSIQRKLDIRSTGELHAFRVERPFNDGIWEFSGIDFEYVFGGKR